MANVYSVTQVNNYIKNMFTQDFLLQGLSIQGEVSNCKYHSSGHIYFTLKDSGGTIACIMFAGFRKGLEFRLEEGQKIVVTGSVDVYERDGRYQLYAKEIRLAGLGQLFERFEALRYSVGREFLHLGCVNERLRMIFIEFLIRCRCKELLFFICPLAHLTTSQCFHPASIPDTGDASMPPHRAGAGRSPLGLVQSISYIPTNTGGRLPSADTPDQGQPFSPPPGAALPEWRIAPIWTSFAVPKG